MSNSHSLSELMRLRIWSGVAIICGRSVSRAL
jgi:hypothetical protein